MGTTTIAAAVINLVINLFTIKWIGVYAAALSTLIANLVVYMYRKRKVRRYIKLNENWKNSFIAFIVTSIVLFLFYSERWTYIVLSCLISVLYAIITNMDMIKIILKPFNNKIIRKR